MRNQFPLPLQAVYAELVERAHLGRMISDFDPAGVFWKKVVRGRDYWYFRSPAVQGRRQDRYVGPDGPELQKRITAHRSAKDDYKQRRAMVSALIRAGMRAPDSATGHILEVLAEAGVFRMRAVVVGTTAYQAFSGLLGVKLGTAANAKTSDLDVAQFRTISVAVEDRVDLPFLDILRRADPHFEPVDEIFVPGRVCRYACGDDYRVDILTPNRGAEDDSPVVLPALQTDAQPLRYLDFLIYQEVQAVALYGTGIPINVPAPERYCLHKLIVSRLRIATTQSQAKSRKDLRQAAELLAVLCEQRPYELRDLWQELNSRGPKWRKMAAEAVHLLDAETGSSMVREKLQTVVGEIATS